MRAAAALFLIALAAGTARRAAADGTVSLTSMLAGEEVSAGGEQVEAAAAKPSGPKGGKPTATGDGTGMDAAVVIAIEGGGGGTGGAGAGGAGGRPRAAFVPYTPDPSAAVCRDGVGAAGRLTVQSCTARYNAVRNACIRLNSQARSLDRQLQSMQGAQSAAVDQGSVIEALTSQVAELQKQVADRDGWLAGNATAAARAAQRWARWVAGNRTQVAARWAGWLAGNVTELEQQLNSGGDGGEGEGGQGEGSATVELAALQAELDACEAAYQAAAEANATCTAWELPALEAERDECLQSGRECQQQRAACVQERDELELAVTDLNATLAECVENGAVVAREAEEAAAAAAEAYFACETSLNDTQSALDDCSVAAGVLRSEAEGLSAEREGLAGDKARCLEAKAVVEEELEGERQENEGLQGVAEDLEECLAALGNATAAAAPAAPVGPVVGR